MNSDKLDKYFKEQIGSLDSVSVPGANWNPQASWEKINQQSGGRRKLFFGGISVVGGRRRGRGVYDQYSVAPGTDGW